MQLPLELLESFAAFARELNFTRAARICGLSQPALHARVARLTELCGEPLYRREGRSLVLTEFGGQLAEFADRLVAQCDRFRQTRTQAREQLPVRLRAGEGCLLYLLGPLLRRCARSSLPLALRVGDAESTMTALLHDQADLGVLATTCVTNEELESRRIAKVHARAAVPRDHPLATRESCRFTDLADDPWIVPPEARPHRLRLDEAWIRHGIRPRIGLEVQGWPLTLHTVSLGIGISIIPDICQIPRGVITLELHDFELPDYHVVRRREALRNAAMSRLWGWFKPV